MSASLSYNNLPRLFQYILNYQPNQTKPNPKLINELNKQTNNETLLKKKI